MAGGKHQMHRHLRGLYYQKRAFAVVFMQNWYIRGLPALPSRNWLGQYMPFRRPRAL